MPRYLIEVPHSDKKEACEMTIRIFLDSGSHFLTHADWGCLDDEHKAWITIEAEDKQQARNILPPAFRRQAVITMVNKFSLDDENKLVSHHVPRDAASGKA
jgi:hypothetical protein